MKKEINNEELAKLTKEIQSIVDEALKDMNDTNKLVEDFQARDKARMASVDILKAKRWNLLKTADLGLSEFEVVTDVRYEDDKLIATTEDLLDTWKANFVKQKEEQDKHADEVLNPKPIESDDSKKEETPKEEPINNETK